VIPFIANILPLIWVVNGILWVEEVDENYYRSLFRIRSAYQDMYQNCDLKGNIITARIVKNEYNIVRESALLFSGGLDAMTTSIRISDKNPLLINIYGWHKDNIIYNEVFESDFKNISEFAIRNNFERTFIQSNFATIVNSEYFNKIYTKKLNDSWWHGLQHGISFIGHAIPIAYKFKIKDIYIASSFSIGGKRYSCSSDPAVDIETKYASGSVVHDGFELKRQDKVALVVKKQKEINSIYPLRVCSFNDKNCCKCEKCFRTILGLIAEGIDKEGLKLFGFYIEKDLKVHFEEIMKNSIQFWGVERELLVHWPNIKKRIFENEDNISEKEFIDWFLNYDFLRERKKAIFKYRVLNWRKILKRKVLSKK
ncbi:peptidase, partial [Clostridium perfringens]